MPPDTLALAPIQTKHRPRFRRASADERPAFRLTDRDRQLLKIIYDYRFITADMLQDLAPAVQLSTRQQEALDKLKAVKKASTLVDRPQRTKREILRRLQMLYHSGYVQRKKLSDHDPIVYSLGNLGAEVLVMQYGIDRKEIEWTTKNRESGEHYIQHTLLVSRFRHAVELVLGNSPDATLEEWLPSGSFKASVQYTDAVKTRAGTRTQVVQKVIIPDGVIVVMVGGKRCHYFLEADRSRMSNARFLSKLKGYYAFWAQRTQEYGIRQMRVISVTISELRKDNLRETAQQVSTEAKDLFWFACERTYAGKPEAVFAPIWQTLKDDTLRSLIP